MSKTEKQINISILQQIYGGLLTERQRDMLSRYYDCDCSLAEIAEETGVSRQAVRDSVKHAEDVLADAEEKIGLMRLKQQLLGCLDKIEIADAEVAEVLQEMRDLIS